MEEEDWSKVERGPEVFYCDNNSDGNDDNREDDGGKPYAKYQPTPWMPGLTNWSLHRAMGVSSEDSPVYTVLSKVLNAVPPKGAASTR